MRHASIIWLACALAAGVSVATPWETKALASCFAEGDSSADDIIVQLDCPKTGVVSTGSDDGSQTSPTLSPQRPYYAELRWNSICSRFSPSSVGYSASCQAERQCADPAQRKEELWGYRAGEWSMLTQACRGGEEAPPAAAAAPAPPPTVTPGLVLQALRRIGLPELEVQTQPADETLVNFATIFYAEPQPFARTITLLGQRVQVEASPAQFTWDHGDGTSASTDSPGAPYPSKEITHNYSDAGVTVRPSLDVTYTARFRVAGGPWRDIPGSVTISGPATSLRVSEATAVLSGEYD